MRRGMGRGMTLIEVLAALAILAAVSVAVSSWSVSAARTSASLTHRLTWERAANAALDVVAGDIITGDLSAAPTDIETVDQGLRIRARDAGPVVNEYTLDDARLVGRSFRVDSRGLTIEADGDPSRVLVGNVTSWSAVLDEDEDGNVIGLSLELVGAGNQRLVRRYTLP